MKNLSSSDRKYLRSQAHHLEPVVLIGKNGINVRLSVKLTGWKIDIMTETEFSETETE